MSFQEEMIAAARGCLGTPFHHQGRNAKTGLDCIGLIAHAAKTGGLPVMDRTDYARQPQAKELFAALEAHGFFSAQEIIAGDVLVFRFNRAPQHVALATAADRMIHAYAPMGKVVETGLGTSWLRRLAAVYRYRE
jgi:NlpC/P60 family putative phage cell wall peptidase